LNRESAFAEATAEEETQRERVGTLATAVAERAERRGALYRTIGVKAVEPPFEVNTRARSLSGPVADAALVRRVAQDLFSEFAGGELRKVGVRVSKLSFPDAEQASLDEF
jgi:DNA polymerase IV (DinB-like DNA polymerase)